MAIFIRNKLHGYYFLALLFFDISTMCSMEMMTDEETCDADDDVAITDLFAQVQQCLGANHNLTENMAKLNHQFQEVQGKLEDIAKLNHQLQEIQEKLEDIAKLNHQFQEIQGKLEDIAQLNHQFQGFEENQRELLTKIEKLHGQSGRQENKRELLTKTEQLHGQSGSQENQTELLTKIEQLHGQSGRQDIVIQRRMDGSVDFYRTWNEYKVGFGDSSGEFFIGLDKLHELTNSGRHELLIVLEDWEGERRYAKYDHFVVGSESESYELKSLGKYTGTAGDSLTYSLGQKFTTKDQDNDKRTYGNCAVQYKGAWWDDNCFESNLNGPYKKGEVPQHELGQIVQWRAFKRDTYSLKFVEMTIRPN